MEISPRSPNEIFELYKVEIEFAAKKLGLDINNVNNRAQLTFFALNVDATARTNSHAPELYEALKAHQAVRSHEMICAQSGWDDNDYVLHGELASKAEALTNTALAKARGEAS